MARSISVLPRQAHRFHRFAGVVVILALALGMTTKTACAQLRGLGGGGGAIGGGVGGIGGAVPGVGGIGGGAGAIGVPSGSSDRIIGTGINIPIEDGGRPSLSIPLTNSVTDPLNNSVTNTLSNSVTNTLSLPGRVTNGVGTSVNQLGRNAGPAPARRSGVPPVGERRYVPNEVVVGLPSSLSPQARAVLLRQHALTALDSHTVGLTGTIFYRLRINDGRSVSDAIRALEADAGVRAAQPNYRFTLARQDDREQAGSDGAQYAVEKLKLPQAHHLATGEKVLVAVIDSGIDATHPEIGGSVAGSFDAIATPDGPHSHGTAMAGAIVAHGKLMGVAPAARILAIRAFGSTVDGAESTTLVLLKAIDWAVGHGARVINMSFAGPTDPEIARALAAARKKGVVMVAAAGNAGPKSPPLFPASDANVIAVTATDSADKLLGVANRGKHIAIAAPGVDIIAAAPGGTYQMTSGTSIATAHVSGIVALLLERKHDLKPDAVRKILLATAKDLGPKGRDEQFGSGLADANRALLSLAATATTAPSRPVSAAAR